MRYNANNDVFDARVAAAHRRRQGAGVFATFVTVHPPTADKTGAGPAVRWASRAWRR